jgi:PEP-CTERM motif
MNFRAMTRILGSIAVLAMSTHVADAALINQAKWTFETSAPSSGDSATISGIVAEEGAGTASGVHASADTDWSNPVGNGSAESFSSNNWAIGDYYEFQTNTLGVGGVQLSWSQSRSGTGPSDFDLQWSTNGSTFNTAMSYVVSSVSMSSVSFKPELVHEANLQNIVALNDQPNVYFRLVATSAPSSTGGTNRVDDFTVAVPEPAAAALMMLASLGLVGIFRRSSR